MRDCFIFMTIHFCRIGFNTTRDCHRRDMQHVAQILLCFSLHFIPFLPIHILIFISRHASHTLMTNIHHIIILALTITVSVSLLLDTTAASSKMKSSRFPRFMRKIKPTSFPKQQKQQQQQVKPGSAAMPMVDGKKYFIRKYPENTLDFHGYDGIPQTQYTYGINWYTSLDEHRPQDSIPMLVKLHQEVGFRNERGTEQMHAWLKGPNHGIQATPIQETK